MTALCICAAVALIAALYLYMIFPPRVRRDTSPFTEGPIAHRGIHGVGGITENTEKAFEAAVKAGAPVELDVRLTHDGVPVVVHDDCLKRLCGVDGFVHSITSDELALFPLRGGECIPTFAEVLELIRGRVPILIELKGTDTSPVAQRTAEMLEGYRGSFAVQSFNPYYLLRFRKLMPAVPLGLLTKRSASGGADGRVFAFFSRNLLFNFLYRPDFVSYKYSDKLTASLRLYRRLGGVTLAWTVTDAGALKHCRRLYDGVICEGLWDLTDDN